MLAAILDLAEFHRRMLSAISTAHNPRNFITLDGAARCWATSTSPTRRITSVQQLSSNVSPDCLRRWGDWWWRAATRSRAKQPGRSAVQRGRSDSFVGTETSTSGCEDELVLVSRSTETAQAAVRHTAVGGLPGEIQACRRWRRRGSPGANPHGEAADACRRWSIWGCRAWIDRSPGPKRTASSTHWSGPVLEAECPSIRGYSDSQIRLHLRPASAARESGFLTRIEPLLLPLRAAHALDLEGQGGPPRVPNWGLRRLPWSRTQYQFILTSQARCG